MAKTGNKKIVQDEKKLKEIRVFFTSPKTGEVETCIAKIEEVPEKIVGRKSIIT